MATVNCPKWKSSFDPMSYYVKGGGGALGLASGAYIGSMFGIAGGPLVAIAGTIPAAILGGALDYLGFDKFASFPSSTKEFML